MQLQSISDDTPNVISITQIRQNIHVLTDALNKFGKVRVLRGQKILFEATDPAFEEKRRERIKKAVAGIKAFAKKNKTEKSKISGSEWIIRERDRMLTPEYYES